MTDKNTDKTSQSCRGDAKWITYIEYENTSKAPISAAIVPLNGLPLREMESRLKCPRIFLARPKGTLVLCAKLTNLLPTKDHIVFVSMDVNVKVI
jgi:hypothetical protein